MTHHPERETITEEEPAQRTAWHVFFRFLLTERAPVGAVIKWEFQLGRELPIADFILLLLDSIDPSTARVLKGLWRYLPKAVVVEFKSIMRPLRPGDIDQLIAYGALYRRMYIADLPLPSDVALVLILPTRTPTFDEQLAAFGWPLEELGGGYWRVQRPDYPLFVAFLSDVAQAEHDALLATFGGRAIMDPMSWAWWYEHGQTRETNMNKPEETPRIQDLPGFDDMVAMLLSSISVESRLRGIPDEERLRGIPDEERLRGIPDEERLRGIPVHERLRDIPLEERLLGVTGFESLLALPAEVLSTFSDEYLNTLPVDVRTELARRLGRTLH